MNNLKVYILDSVFNILRNQSESCQLIQLMIDILPNEYTLRAKYVLVNMLFMYLIHFSLELEFRQNFGRLAIRV